MSSLLEQNLFPQNTSTFHSFRIVTCTSLCIPLKKRKGVHPWPSDKQIRWTDSYVKSQIILLRL